MSNYCHFLCSLTCLDQNVLYFLFLVNLSIKSTHQEGNLSIHQEGNLPEGVLSNILSNLIMIFFFKKSKEKCHLSKIVPICIFYTLWQKNKTIFFKFKIVFVKNTSKNYDLR